MPLETEQAEQVTVGVDHRTTTLADSDHLGPDQLRVSLGTDQPVGSQAGPGQRHPGGPLPQVGLDQRAEQPAVLGDQHQVELRVRQHCTRLLDGERPRMGARHAHHQAAHRHRP